MKAKLFAFIGLAVAAIGASLIFGSTPVYAAGESYTWVNQNTIQASGGSYENVNAAEDGTVRFTRGDDFTIFSEGGCDITITLTPSPSNRFGTLFSQGCEDNPANTFDIEFEIGNPQNGPPIPGSDIDFAELDCSDFAEVPGTDEDFTEQRNRCEAMQACIEAGDLQSNCLIIWQTCVDERHNTFSCRTDMVAGNLQLPDDEIEEGGTTCAIDGIGWILCPVLNFTAWIADGAYGIVDNFLSVQPLYTTGSNEPIYEAWSVMRNIANVAFAIVFLIIIFSQITSVGISNYGIKRMLPRLIIAAILVNVSYWICAIAVDITNILGGSIKALFDNIGAGLTPPDFSGFQTQSTWSAFVSGILALTIISLGVLYVTLSALLPLLVSAVFAVLAAFVILAIRQALIILLIIISPLAFVAFLLPNTQSLFTKWRNLFQTLLLMYPIIALIFGASALASQVITASAASIENEGLRVVTQIFGAATASVPLALAAIIPRLAGRLGNFVNDPARGVVDRSRKRAEAFRDRRQNIAADRRIKRAKGVLEGEGGRLGEKGSRRRRMTAWVAGAGKTGGLNAEQKDVSAQKSLEETKRNYVADRAAEDDKYAKSIAGPTGDVNAVQAAALSAQKKAFSESVSDMEALIKVRFDDPQEALQEALEKGDKVQAVAAQNLLFKSGGSGVSKFRSTVEAAEGAASHDPALQQNLNDVAPGLKENVQSNHGQYVKQKGADIVSWAGSTGKNLTDSQAAGKAGDLSDRDLASQHHASLKKTIEQGLVDGAQAGRMLKDPRIAADLDDQQKNLLRSVPGSDTRPAPSQRELNQAHEQAIQEEARRNPPPPPRGP